jgi:hypothetical protein
MGGYGDLLMMKRRAYGRGGGRFLGTAALFLALGLFPGLSPIPDFPPVPRSEVISGVTFQWSTHVRKAPGSDILAITWAGDDHQYVVWGDGGGFGGTNREGRVPIGIARIEGPHDGYEARNVFGGKDAEHPARPLGYSWGIVSVDDVLYMLAGDTRSEVHVSEDRGATWRGTGWSLGKHTGPFGHPTILNFGKNYEGARDDYVYIYGTTNAGPAQSPSDVVDLARVPKDRITVREEYEFFAGIGEGGEPRWTRDIEMRVPTFRWPGKVHWCVSVSHAPGVDRYLLSFNSRKFKEGTNLVILDAPKPWGPWTLAASVRDFGGGGYTFSYYFSPKWWRNGGKEFTLVYSGTGENDSWNTVSGSLLLKEPVTVRGSRRDV